MSLALLTAATLAAAAPGAAPAGDCAAAILAAARVHGVPAATLLAIGRVESGLTPWTINAAGVPYRFASREVAVAATQALLRRGVASIDVGCLQINLQWHPAAFASLAEAFDPQANADYGARFLAALYRQAGNWTQAVGNYHSAWPAEHARYVAAVQAALGLPPGTGSGTEPRPVTPPDSAAAGPAPVRPAALDPERAARRRMLLAGGGPIEPEGEGAALLAAERGRLLAAGGGSMFPPGSEARP